MKTPFGRKESAEARRLLIIETAALCFIDQGFHQTSIRDIAKRAGISLGNLYNHFEGKGALIAEIASLEATDIKKIENNVGKITKPDQALKKFIALYLDYCSQTQNVALSAEILAEAVRNPSIASGFLHNRQRLVDLITGLMRGMANEKQTQNSQETNDRAQFILDLIEGLATRSVFSAKKPSKRDVMHLQETIDRLVAS
ncbi:MAG: TetR/AcrR family transcriptional regulator [Stappiaceae bacterium]